MTDYTLDAFLLMQSVGDRLVAGLINNKFTVKPAFRNNSAYFIGDISTVACFDLKHIECDRTKVFELINSIIRDNKIPCFGYILVSMSDNVRVLFGGYMPSVETKVEQGPYR